MRSLRWVSIAAVAAACSIDLEPLSTISLDAGKVGGKGGADASAGSCSGASCGSGGISTEGGTGGASGSGGGAGSPLGGSAGVISSGGVAGSIASGGTGALPSGGGGVTFGCADLGKVGFNCEFPNPQTCQCQGCDQFFCADPNDGYPLSDCVCPACVGHPYCFDPNPYCFNDNLCDPFNESCACPDCFWVSWCK